MAKPDDTNCASPSDSDSYAQDVRVEQKFLTQYFNPSYFVENKDLEYVALNRIELDLDSSVTKTKHFDLQLHDVYFFDGKIINV